jgi:hypothetical protein
MSKVNTVSAEFTRPNDTTAYASGDLVANNTNDSAVVPLTFTPAAELLNRGFAVRRVKLHKSGTGVTSAAFRVHLFSAEPTFTTAGDNGALSTVLQGSADWLGAFDIAAMFAFQDGAIGEGDAVDGGSVYVTPRSDLDLFAVVEARGAYGPAAGEVFTVTLEIEWL